MTAKERIVYEADEILPGINLDQLLRKSSRKAPRRFEDSQKIHALLNSGKYYLSPCWLASYYPETEKNLSGIKINPKYESLTAKIKP